MSGNTQEPPQFTSKTIFGTITKFEDIQGRTIKTEHFLRACTDVTSILGKSCGRLFLFLSSGSSCIHHHHHVPGEIV